MKPVKCCWLDNIVTMQTAQKYSLYDQLMELPETLTGEILNGQLHTQPRPSGPHALAGSSLGYDKLVNDHWTKLADFSGEDLVVVAPFDAITIALSDLWG